MFHLHRIIASGDIDLADTLYNSRGWGRSAASQIRGACRLWGINPRRFGVRAWPTTTAKRGA
jgi:hypothetical protein